MKQYILIICFLCLVLLTACGSDSEQEAWDACTSAAGTPTGNTVNGLIFEVDTVNGGELGRNLLDVEDLAIESLRPKYVAEAEDYIGFDKEGTGVNPDLTHKLEEASAVLCAEITTYQHKTCGFSNSTFKVIYHNTIVHLKLLSWPSKEFIAETTLDSKWDEIECPSQILLVGDQGQTDDVVTAWVNLIPWLTTYFVK